MCACVVDDDKSGVSSRDKVNYGCYASLCAGHGTHVGTDAFAPILPTHIYFVFRSGSSCEKEVCSVQISFPQKIFRANCNLSHMCVANRD